MIDNHTCLNSLVTIKSIAISCGHISEQINCHSARCQHGNLNTFYTKLFDSELERFPIETNVPEFVLESYVKYKKSTSLIPLQEENAQSY